MEPIRNDWTIGKDKATGEKFPARVAWEAELGDNPRGVAAITLVQGRSGARDGEYGLIIRFHDDQPDTGCMMSEAALVAIGMAALHLAGEDAVAKYLAKFGGIV